MKCDLKEETGRNKEEMRRQSRLKQHVARYLEQNRLKTVDVRCYCNLPMCVSSNYMCRSSEGVCVSERGATEAWSWRHACIELITIDARQMATLDCKKNDTRQCCMNDMCNYFWKVPSNRNQNHTYITGYLSNHDTSLLRGGHSVDPQPWFKVTVVAVPVAGGLILITLIVMAVKMLRAESLRQTRLKPIETHHVVYQTRKNCFPKSASCVLLSSCHTGHIVRSYASMGTLERADSFCRSSSFALSTDSGCSDSSKEKYFVFDV